MRAINSDIKAFLFTPNHYFSIPDFQRPYSWETINVRSFLEDLEYTKAGDRKHYFGSIVYIKNTDNSKESVIIDGQQRATTVLLMITAIYHRIRIDENLSKTSADEINENFLYNKYGDVDNRIKLRAVTVDHGIYKKIYEQAVLTAEEKASRLYQTYKLFNDYFSGKTNLDEYIDILESFEIVDISLGADDDNPQKIFESINSTGKPLTDGDRIRNFALMLNDAAARKYVFENYWQHIEQKLTYVNQDYVTDFFKNFLTAYSQQEVKLEQVYPAFKRLFEEQVGEEQANIDLLKDFYDTVLSGLTHYLLLKFTTQPDDDAYEFIADRVFRLNFLKIETPYPFLMKVLERYQHQELTKTEVSKIFAILESYLTRRLICNIPTTGLNKLFATLDKDITAYQQEIEGAAYTDVFAYVLLDKSNLSRFPRTKEIQATVPTNPFYSQRNWYINFVLSSVDDLTQSKESALLKKIAPGNSDISIEHIMPQTITPAWTQELGPEYEDIHTQYIHTLPNLTLTGYNSKYSNRSFDEKKTIENGFNDSPFLINLPIKETQHWNREALEARTNWWTAKIQKLWPVPETSFAPPKTDTEVSLLDDIDFKGTSIKSVQVLGDVSNVSTWSQALEIIVERLFQQDPQLGFKISDDEFLTRYITREPESLQNPVEIDDTEYYLDTANDTNRKRNVVQKLATLMNLERSDITVELIKSKDA